MTLYLFSMALTFAMLGYGAALFMHRLPAKTPMDWWMAGGCVGCAVVNFYAVASLT